MTVAAWRDTYAVQWMDRNPRTPSEMDALYHQRFGITRTDLNAQFLANVPKDARILEIGSSRGVQLQLLADAGFTDLVASDLAEDALRLNPWSSTAADAVHLPFTDGAFDLVFTSGTIMHVPLKKKNRAMREMRRVSRRWIWGFELWESRLRMADGKMSHVPTWLHVTWPNHLPDGWLEDYPRAFMTACPDLGLTKEQVIGTERNVHIMYLLEVVS